MTAARKLTVAELNAWERFAAEAYRGRLALLDDPPPRSEVLAQYAAADADALLRQWRRRAGRPRIQAPHPLEQWRRDHGEKP
jgi:hypothetical protein